MATEENENFLRLTLLVFECGTFIARHILYREIVNLGGQTLDVLLNFKKERIHKTFSGKELEKLFPKTGKPDPETWDFALLSGVLLYVVSLVKTERRQIEKLRFVRHEICHVHSPEFDQQTYTNTFETITCALEKLCKNLNPGIQNECKELIKECTRERVDYTSTLEYMKEKAEGGIELFKIVLSKFQGLEKGIRELKEDTEKILQKLDVMSEDQLSIPILTDIGIKIKVEGATSEQRKFIQNEIIEKVNLPNNTCVNTGDVNEITSAVNHLLTALKNINGVQVEGAEQGSILLKVKCTSLGALYALLHYIENESFSSDLLAISIAIQKKHGISCVLTAHGTMNNYSQIGEILSLAKQENDVLQYRKGEDCESLLTLHVKVKSTRALLEVWSLFEEGRASESLHRISEAFSNLTGSQVTLSAEMNLRQLNEALQSTEKTLKQKGGAMYDTRTLRSMTQMDIPENKVFSRFDMAINMLNEDSGSSRGGETTSHIRQSGEPAVVHSRSKSQDETTGANEQAEDSDSSKSGATASHLDESTGANEQAEDSDSSEGGATASQQQDKTTEAKEHVEDCDSSSSGATGSQLEQSGVPEVVNSRSKPPDRTTEANEHAENSDSLTREATIPHLEQSGVPVVHSISNSPDRTTEPNEQTDSDSSKRGATASHLEQSGVPEVVHSRSKSQDKTSKETNAERSFVIRKGKTRFLRLYRLEEMITQTLLERKEFRKEQEIGEELNIKGTSVNILKVETAQLLHIFVERLLQNGQRSPASKLESAVTDVIRLIHSVKDVYIHEIVDKCVLLKIRCSSCRSMRELLRLLQTDDFENAIKRIGTSLHEQCSSITGVYANVCDESIKVVESHLNENGVKTDQLDSVRCESHPEESANMYCSDHFSFCCQQCAQEKHGLCPGLRLKTAITGRELDEIEVITEKRIKVKKDKMTCDIYGCCVLQNGEMLLVDNNNKRIKKVNQNFKVVSHCSLSDKPYAVCDVENNEAAVALYDCVQFVNYEGKLSRTRLIKFDHDSNGLLYDGKLLFVVDDYKVYTYSHDLNNKKELYSRKPGEVWFNNIAVSKHSNRIYISDRFGGVHIIDTDGNHLCTLKPQELKNTWGICLDKEERVLVTDQDTCCIYRIDYQGDQSTIEPIITQGDNIAKPMCVSYNSLTSNLIIGHYQKDQVSLFELK